MSLMNAGLFCRCEENILEHFVQLWHFPIQINRTKRQSSSGALQETHAFGLPPFSSYGGHSLKNICFLPNLRALMGIFFTFQVSKYGYWRYLLMEDAASHLILQSLFITCWKRGENKLGWDRISAQLTYCFPFRRTALHQWHCLPLM